MKDRIENFDGYYYPSIQKDDSECNLLYHVHNWIQLFVSMYNNTIYNEDKFIINFQKEVNKILN